MEPDDRGHDIARAAARTAPDEVTPRQLLARPTRLLTLAGVGLLVAGVLLPWADIRSPFSVEKIDGLSGAGDGATAFLLAILLLAVIASPPASTSRTRIVQALPGILGVGTFLVAIIVVRILGAREQAFAASEHLDVLPGLVLLFAGSALASLGGVATSVSVARAHPPLPGGASRAFEPGTAAEAAVAIPFAIVGAILPVLVAVALLNGGGAGTPGLVLVAIFGFAYGGVVGALAGVRVLRYLRHRLGRGS